MVPFGHGTRNQYNEDVEKNERVIHEIEYNEDIKNNVLVIHKIEYNEDVKKNVLVYSISACNELDANDLSWHRVRCLTTCSISAFPKLLIRLFTMRVKHWRCNCRHPNRRPMMSTLNRVKGAKVQNVVLRNFSQHFTWFSYRNIFW